MCVTKGKLRQDQVRDAFHALKREREREEILEVVIFTISLTPYEKSIILGFCEKWHASNFSRSQVVNSSRRETFSCYVFCVDAFLRLKMM